MFVPIVIGGSEPGSVTYSTPGTYSFTVPEYTALEVDVKGAGGGSGRTHDHTGTSDGCYSSGGYNGVSGGQSSFNANVIGYGGTYGTVSGTPGSAGSASGGDTNTAGGGAAGGSPGGTGAQSVPWCYAQPGYGANGGNGGRAVKGYTSGGLTPGSTVTIVVGSAGYGYVYGGNGSVTISWT